MKDKIRKVFKNDILIFSLILGILMAIAYYRNFQNYENMRKLSEKSQLPLRPQNQ